MKNITAFSLAALLLFVCFSSPLHSEEKKKAPDTDEIFSQNYAKRLWKDTSFILAAPEKKWKKQEWLAFTVLSLSTAAIMTQDKNIRDAAGPYKKNSADKFIDSFDPVGAQYAFYVTGGFYALGHLLKWDEGNAIAADALEAKIIAGGIITSSLKGMAGRKRPDASNDPYFYKPFSENTSFPSGHTTAAFALFTVIAQHSNNFWLKFASYGTATMVGVSRINKNAHWASDVFAGAVIGYTVGKTVVRLNKQRKTKSANDAGCCSYTPSAAHINVMAFPFFSQEQKGMAVVIKFR